MFSLRYNHILVLAAFSLVACGNSDNTANSQIDNEEMSSSETFVSSSSSDLEHSISSKKFVSSSSLMLLSSSLASVSSSSLMLLSSSLASVSSSSVKVSSSSVVPISSSSSVVIASYSYPDWANCVSEGRCGTFKDSRDDHVYKKVTIGTQTWMAENLAYLPSVNKSPESSGFDAMYYVYNFDGTDADAAKTSSYYTAYGVLYNWLAAKDACPTGWHLPDTTEWNTLVDYASGNSTAGPKLNSVSGWANDTGTDAYGFSALPGGCYYVGVGTGFYYVRSSAYWWTATKYDSGNAYQRGVFYNYTFVSTYHDKMNIGRSVRCIQD